MLFGGSGPTSLRVGALVALVVAIGGLAWREPDWARAGLFGTLASVTIGYLLLVRPSNERNWSEDQARVPSVRFDGDLVHIGDFRRFRYRSVEDFDPHWEEVTFDLDRLVGADLGIEQFGPHEAIGHTFASFRFDDGAVLVVSVEIRKEQGESFSPLRGLYRQYEKMIVLGDERDLVELRAVHREDPVFLHPLDVPVPKIRVFLQSVLEEAARLREHPAFYNTVLASCSSTLAWHLRAMGEVPLDPRLFLPGYVDALAWELGWFGPGTLEALRAQNRIDDRARAAAGTDRFSKAIRNP